MSQCFLDRKRVHLAAQTFAGPQSGLQIMPSNFHGERIRNGFAGALLVLHPGGVGQRHPDGSSVDQKLDIDGIGVPRGDGDDERLVDAVNLLLRPTIGGGEISKHGYRNYNGGDEARANNEGADKDRDNNFFWTIAKILR
jgi:hypothetical protein